MQCLPVQALAVLRLEPREGLLAACDEWMSSNIALMLPNHIVAYLNVCPSASALPRSS